MNGNITRPLPNVNDKLYEPYFKGLKEQKILVQHCEDCGYLQWSPRSFCFTCHASKLGWMEIPKEGTVYSFSVYYRAFHPAFKKDLPYGVIVADIGNGIRMLGKYAGADVEEIECGMKVKAGFEDIDNETTLLQWERSEK